MPSYGNILAYVRKAYAIQQETLSMVESQMGEWQKHMPGTLASQRAGKAWAESMLQLIRELTAVSEELGSMRRFLRAIKDGSVRTSTEKPSGSL